MIHAEHRAKCIEAMLCAYETEVGSPADYNGMFEAFRALHGLARVNPLEATEDMVDAAWRIPCIGDQEPSYREVYSAMSAAGDLTNPPETKP